MSSLQDCLSKTMLNLHAKYFMYAGALRTARLIETEETNTLLKDNNYLMLSIFKSCFNVINEATGKCLINLDNYKKNIGS